MLARLPYRALFIGFLWALSFGLSLFWDFIVLNGPARNRFGITLFLPCGIGCPLGTTFCLGSSLGTIILSAVTFRYRILFCDGLLPS